MIILDPIVYLELTNSISYCIGTNKILMKLKSIALSLNIILFFN